MLHLRFIYLNTSVVLFKKVTHDDPFKIKKVYTREDDAITHQSDIV